MAAQINIGDRVRVIQQEDHALIGMTGIVVAIEEKKYGVKFDNFFI